MGVIIHGNKNFGFAPINDNGDNTFSFGTPVMIPGLYSMTIEVSQEDTNIFADDSVYCAVKGARVRTATATLRNIPAAYLPYLGYLLQDNGGYADTGIFPSHCIFFETGSENCADGSTTRRLHYLYNVRASQPTQESQTDEDTVEAQNIEVNYTCTDSDIAVDDDGVKVQYYFIDRTEANKDLFDTFETAVILPTSEIPSAG